MSFKEGDKVFVPACPIAMGMVQHEDGTVERITDKPDLGYWHTLTKEEADSKNHMSELFNKWAKELEELTNG